MSDFKTVKLLTVRRDFSAGPEPDSFNLHRDCGRGCTCRATIYKVRSPLPKLAEDKCLCFNSITKLGVSEMAGSARPVPAAAGVSAFEVQAELVQYIGKAA